MNHDAFTKIRSGGAIGAAAWSALAARFVCAVVAAAVLAACASTPPAARSGRVVMSQHQRWTIRVVPTLTDRWRARVQVWPPEVSPQTSGGINLHFTESASTEGAIVQAATASARRYIDASRSTQ